MKLCFTSDRDSPCVENSILCSEREIPFYSPCREGEDVTWFLKCSVKESNTSSQEWSWASHPNNTAVVDAFPVNVQTALKGFWGAVTPQLCSLTEREEQATGKGATLFTLLRYLDKKYWLDAPVEQASRNFFLFLGKKKLVVFRTRNYVIFFIILL